MTRLGVLLATSIFAFALTIVAASLTYPPDVEPSLPWQAFFAFEFLFMVITALLILFQFALGFVRAMRFELNRIRLMREVQRRG